jgi:hypothetical protein
MLHRESAISEPTVQVLFMQLPTFGSALFLETKEE